MDDLTALKAVDLDGYSRSPGWLGYSQACEPFSWSTAVRAAELGLTFMRQSNESLVLLSSTHTDPAWNARQPSVEGFASLSALVDAGLLRSVNYAKFESPLASDAAWQTGRDLAWNSFHSLAFTPSLDADITRLLAAKMSFFEAMGHCFVLMRERGLLVYPHDDCGLGVIAVHAEADRDFGRRLIMATGPTHHLEGVDASRRGFND